MTLKAVIFQLGDVLVRTIDDSLRTAWEQGLNLAPGQAEHIVFGGETGWAVQLGQISDAEHWRWIQARLNLSDEALARFHHDFFAGDRLDQGLLAYISHLRSRYHVGLLSNASDRLREMLTSEPWGSRGGVTPPLPQGGGIIEYFDSVTISAEEGVMKPDPRIYRIALARAGVQPDEALFIDDALRNIEGARACGMGTLHYVGPVAARRQLVMLTGVEDDDR